MKFFKPFRPPRYAWQRNPVFQVFASVSLAIVLLAVLIVAFLGLNGETNWFEGTLLLALYGVLAIVFFYIPTAAPAH